MSVNVGKAVGYLELDTSKFTSGFKSAMSDLKTFEDSTATTNDKLRATSSAMTSVGSSLTKYVTVPLAAAGAGALKMSADFGQAMAETKAVSGATAKEFDALKQEALDLGESTAYSATEVANAMTEMAKAGWDSQQIIDGMGGVLDAAASSGENLATVSTIVADAITGFGLAASDSTKVADLLAQAANSGTIDINDLGESFKYVAPVAKAMGYNIEDVTTALSAMSQAGIKGSQAGTSLRTVFTNMANPTENMQIAMDKLGVSLYDSSGNMYSMKEIIDQLRDGFNNLDVAQGQSKDAMQAQLAAMLAGKEGMSGLLSIVTMSQEEYDKLSASMYNSAGVANETATVMQDNLNSTMEQFGGAIETLAIKIGDILTPTVQSIVQGLTNVVQSISNLSPAALQIVTIIGVVLAALGPLLLIGGKLLTGFLTIKTLLATTGTSLLSLTGPLAIVIAAVAAFALAWTTNFAGIRDTVSTVMTEISQIITTILTAIKTAWDNDFLLIRSTVSYYFEQIKTIIQGALGVIEGIVQVFSGVIQGDWSKVWDGVKKIASSIWDMIVKLVKNWLNNIVDSVIKIAANLYVAAKNAFQKVKDGFLEKWEAIKEWFALAKKDPVKAIKSLFKSMLQAGKDLINNLWKGLKSAWKTVKGWFESIGNWIKDKLQFWKDSVADAEASARSADSGSRNASNNSGKKAKGYAKGLSYVPYDGFPAILHKGERVLTADEASAYNKGATGGGGTYEFNFYNPQELSPAEQARQFKKTMNQLLFNM